MNYVDKSIAMKYLANSEKIFNKVKESFLNTYKNGVEEINTLYQENDVDALYRYIHSLKGISLNVGSMILYEDACSILEKIKKKEDNLPSLDQFIYTFRNVYLELSRL